MNKLTKKKYDLSPYSTMLDLNIEDFTAKIRGEVIAKLDVRAAVERNDTASINKALAEHHIVVTHLISEHRRIKDKWLETRIEFETIEIAALNFARSELPTKPKPTEKEIKSLAYENEGEQILTLRSQLERLEQQWKTVQDHRDAASKALSAIQTLSKNITMEWESSKHA